MDDSRNHNLQFAHLTLTSPVSICGAIDGRQQDSTGQGAKGGAGLSCTSEGAEVVRILRWLLPSGVIGSQ